VRRRAVVLFLLVAWMLPSPAIAENAVEQVDLLIRGGTVVSMDAQARVIEKGAIAIRGERIVAVGTDAEITTRYRATRTLDASGKAILPGLINAHTHVPMVLFRGLADDLSLMDWLHQHIFPAEAKNVDAEFVRWGTRLGCLEMIRAGTTTFVDMYYFETIAAAETAQAGMRAVLGQTVIDFPVPDYKTWPEAMAGAEQFVRKWQGHPLIRPAIAPHATYTVSPEHLKEAHAFSVRHEVPLVIHVAETEDEQKIIRTKYGATPVGFLENLGVLDRRVIAAHCVWVNDPDMRTLAERSVGVAHCPNSNMKLASGVAPVPQLLRAGVAVGLGSDGAASNNTVDVWHELDTAAKLHKVIAKDPKVLNAHEALTLATIGGARAIHLEREIGSLEPGKRADVILVHLDHPHQTPLYHVISQLVYTAKFADVATVIINGRIVMEDRRMLTLDEPSILAKARAYRDKIRKNGG
jgi:5-methylthioadenosine/S-adenosylhomocysteine deaminase